MTTKDNLKEPGWVTFLIFMLIAVAINIWAVLYINNSRFIYYWDNTLYWSAARSLSDIPFDKGLWIRLYTTVGTDEYNMIASFLPALVMKFFGKSRLVFILSVINCYFLPCIALIFNLTKKYFKYYGVAAFSIILSLPIMLFTGLVGFVDIGALFFALLCMRLYFSDDPEKYTIPRYMAIGILMVFSMLFRRYFAFFAFSFATAMLGISIIYGRKKLGIILMFILMGLTLFAGFPEFTFNQLLRDYGTLYSSYKFSINTDILLFTRYFGIAMLIFLIAGSIYVFLKNKNFGFIFLWMQSALCFLMFVFTQTHGQQHLLLYVPSIIMTLLFIVPNIEKKKFKLICLCSSVLFTGNTLINREQPQSIREIKHYAVIPDFSMRARVRHDTGQILALKQYLNETVGLEKKVGVLASGFVLNDDILRNCEISLGIENPREDFFVPLPSVDSKDSDFSALFETDYMVVAYPCQTHLGSENQRIITEAVNCFAENKGFAEAFSTIAGDFKIGDITVYIYRREREVSESQKQEFLELFI